MARTAHPSWNVLKFGGTSVSSAANWRNIAQVVAARRADGDRVLVVHSAITGITDRLERLLAAAQQGSGQGEPGVGHQRQPGAHQAQPGAGQGRPGNGQGNPHPAGQYGDPHLQGQQGDPHPLATPITRHARPARHRPGHGYLTADSVPRPGCGVAAARWAGWPA